MSKCTKCGKEFEGESWKKLCNDCYIQDKEEREGKAVSKESTEKKIEEVDLKKISNTMLIELINSRIITGQGLRVQGMGILIRKLEKLIQLQSSANSHLHHIEDKIDKLRLRQ